MFILRTVLPLLASVIILSGCIFENAIDEADLFGIRRTNVADYAYSAADLLLEVGVREKQITTKTPIGFERLVPLQGLDPRGRLASLLPEHMGTRIAERGYIAVGVERQLKPDYLIVGTYTLIHPYIQVSLRLVRADNRSLIGATAFKMRLTRNLRDLVSLPPIGVSLSDEEVLKSQQRNRMGLPKEPIPAHNRVDPVTLPPLPPGQMTPSGELPMRVIP